MQQGSFARLVGVGVLVLAACAGAAMLLITIAASEEIAFEEPDSARLGLWRILFNTAAPSLRVVFAAILLALLLALGIALLERRILLRSRRSSNIVRHPLAPKIIMADTRGAFHGPVTVTTLIPAHNEEEIIAETIRAVQHQSLPPSRIIVVADNCTDRTADIARSLGVEVFETVANREKKAGALNQALSTLLEDCGPNDTIMVLDADTILETGFIEAAVRRFELDRALMAVGGLFTGESGHGIIGQFQRNEYLRYRREIGRRRGRVFVLTGTASIFRATALRAVRAERGVSLPGTPGTVYDTHALTEDNELTLAIKSLGGLMTSPRDCRVVTELMPDWRRLWAQRLRWQRGALENLGAYRVTPHTFRYWAQQLGIGYGVIALTSFFVLMLIMIVAVDRWIWFPFWLGIGSVFLVERVVTVWRGGREARWLAALIIPELIYDMFLNIVYVAGVLEISLGRTAEWGNGVEPDRTLAAPEIGDHGEVRS